MMTMVSAPSSHLFPACFIWGRGVHRLVVFFSLRLSFSLHSFLVEGRVPSQVNGGPQTRQEGGGEEGIRTVKSYP